jgi:hypothetical protein
MTMPHMAHHGGEQVPVCIPGCAGQEEHDPTRHKSVCPYGNFLIQADDLKSRSQPVDLGRERLDTEPGPPPPELVVHHCDCYQMMLQEAKSFESEAATHEAGSRLNLLFLGQAEYLRQLSSRILVRQRFMAMMTNAGG